MKNIGRFTSLISLLACMPLAAGSQEPAAHPVLIELFTSQGCSSCPPAETLLNGWGMDLFRQGKALPLAFHVDYWDYLGWKDPFSSALFTQRQRLYGAKWRASSIYTPQMVVGGTDGFVGSDARKAARTAQEQGSRVPYAGLTLKTSLRDGKVHLKVHLGTSKVPQAKGPWKVMAVIFENGLHTHVQAGENEGRDLEENFVARQLAELQTVTLQKGQTLDAELSLRPEWNKAKLGVAVFLQDTSSLAIDAVHWVYPL